MKRNGKLLVITFLASLGPVLNSGLEGESRMPQPGQFAAAEAFGDSGAANSSIRGRSASQELTNAPLRTA
jgi:hypothetical protein